MCFISFFTVVKLGSKTTVACIAETGKNYMTMCVHAYKRHFYTLPRNSRPFNIIYALAWHIYFWLHISDITTSTSQATVVACGYAVFFTHN